MEVREVLRSLLGGNSEAVGEIYVQALYMQLMFMLQIGTTHALVGSSHDLHSHGRELQAILRIHRMLSQCKIIAVFTYPPNLSHAPPLIQPYPKL